MSPAGSLRTIAEQFGIDVLYAFGSRAVEALAFVEGRGDFDSAQRSDLDIAAPPVPGRTWGAADRVDLMQALEAVFPAPRIDLVALPDAPPFLALAAVTGELLYARATHAAKPSISSTSLRRAGDLAPFERERRDWLLNTPLR